MLIYKVPAEPGRNRLSVWRKIKALGAVYLQNGVCVLPPIDDHARRLKILQNDIAEMGGGSFLLDCNGFDQAQVDRIIDRFSIERNEAYAEFIERCDGFEDEIRRESAASKFTYAELEENDEDLKKLRSWLEKIRTIDFYEASLAPEAAQRLAQCAELLDQFADQVFAAQDENRPDADAASRLPVSPIKGEGDD
ncbi:chromate resistance protein ChrB [Hoeflea alexandrii]|uniref:Chromate resistance protein ChrB n=1 Tax=Hoeflea alexandrii TaxID=288436 RepID=UPI002271E2D8|nr:Chromate resistance protein ChrB [Hoeflea alexandrii]MCY0150941.1 chromate resistance protein ChrB [Hoeflea alexandrii]